MLKNREISMPQRRQFLLRDLPSVGLCCMSGLGSSVFTDLCSGNRPQSSKHKFFEDSKMSFKQVFDFAFKRRFIESMKILGKMIGKERFLEMLSQASAEAAARATKASIKDLQKTDFAAFVEASKLDDRFWSHVTTIEPFEKTESEYEIRVTECLWAQTFREEKAEDFGYATHCHVDFAAAAAFNQNIRMYRTKTLMQGDEYCDHRWVWES